MRYISTPRKRGVDIYRHGVGWTAYFSVAFGDAQNRICSKHCPRFSHFSSQAKPGQARPITNHTQHTVKKFIALAMAVVATATMAFAATETVYLKNGSVIKGEIIEQIPGKSIKVQTKDGSIWVYDVDEIEKITKEDASAAEGADCNIRHRKLDFTVATGYNIATKGGSGSVPIDFTVSKRFSPYFSAGVGAGIDIGTASGSDPIIPIFASFKGFLPLTSTKVTPFAEVRGGYAINTNSSQYASNYGLFSIMPGVRMPINHRMDVDLGVGYVHYMASGGGSGAVMFKVGINFHASTDPNRVLKPKKIVPTYDSGLEVGLEAGMPLGWGGGLVVGYKFSPKLSFGLGVNFSEIQKTEPESNITFYREPDGQGEVVGEHDYSYKEEKSGYGNFQIFLRAQYRLTDRKFSPIASVDLGYRKGTGDDLNNYYSYILLDMYHGGIDQAMERAEQDGIKAKSSGFFIRPMVGISLRIGSNSYLEAKVGANITNGISKLDKVVNTSGNWNGIGSNRFQSVRGYCDGTSFSGFSFSIAWKHTFNVFGRH